MDKFLPPPLTEWVLSLSEEEQVFGEVLEVSSRKYLFIFAIFRESKKHLEIPEIPPTEKVGEWLYYSETPRQIVGFRWYGWVLPNPTEEHLRQVQKLFEEAGASEGNLSWSPIRKLYE